MTKLRLFAVWIDSLLALLAGGLLGAPFEDPSHRVLLSLAGYVGYFFVPEWIWSATPGKLVFGLRIVHLDGRPAGLWAAGWRTLLRVFEANPFLLGVLPAGLAIVWSKRKQRIGDMIAKTVVVRRSALEPAPEPTPPQPPSHTVAKNPAKPKPEALPGWLQAFLLLEVPVDKIFGGATRPPAAGAPPPTPAPADPFRGRATIQCPHCGTRVLATAQFCRSCKQALSDGTPGASLV